MSFWERREDMVLHIRLLVSVIGRKVVSVVAFAL